MAVERARQWSRQIHNEIKKVTKSVQERAGSRGGGGRRAVFINMGQTRLASQHQPMQQDR